MTATPIARALLMPALCLALLTVAPASWAQSRPGTIEAMEAIENRGDDTSEQKKKGRKWGERIGKYGGMAASVGATMSGNSTVGYAGAVVSSTQGDRIGGAIGERVAGEGPTARYMVKVRLDEGRVLTLTQPAEQVQGLSVGSRVRVEGSGDEAKLVSQ